MSQRGPFGAMPPTNPASVPTADWQECVVEMPAPTRLRDWWRMWRLARRGDLAVSVKLGAETNRVMWVGAVRIVDRSAT